MNLREAAEAAIKTLEYAADVADRPGLMDMCDKTAELLRTALTEAEEPVAWASENVIPLRGQRDNHVAILTPFKCTANTAPLYTHPPRREPLSESAIDNLAAQCVKGNKSVQWALREVERAHGIGGGE